MSVELLSVNVVFIREEVGYVIRVRKNNTETDYGPWKDIPHLLAMFQHYAKNEFIRTLITGDE